MSDNQEQKMWRNAFRSLMRNMPTDYATQHGAMRDMRRVFHEELAEAITQSFNEHIDKSAQDSLAEKKELATSVNADLRRIGCAIRCEKMGLPGILAADAQSVDQPGVSRFRLVVVDDHGKTHRTLTVKYLPRLTVIPDAERSESLARDRRRQ